jgi:hypothetical protein
MLLPPTSSHISLKYGLIRVIHHLNLTTWANYYGRPIENIHIILRPLLQGNVKMSLFIIPK